MMLTRYRIALVIGSLRQGSFNRQLAAMLDARAPDDFLLHRVEIGDLPLYNQDDDEHQAPAVLRLRDDILTSAAVIFVTPEYNRSIPGVLKNAIDHASRPYGASAWRRKPAGVVGVSEGAMGTSLAQQHLRNILASLDMPTLGLPEIFIQAKQGMFADTESAATDLVPILTNWMAAFAPWVRRINSDNA